MLKELNTNNKIVGAKQVRRAVKEEKVEKVFIAEDVEEKIVADIKKMCQQKSIDIVYVKSMNELGKACGIDVNAAIAALLK